MELTKENKEKIDNWFKDKSKEELEYIFNVYSDEKIKVGDKITFKNERPRVTIGKEYIVCQIDTTINEDGVDMCYWFYNDRNRISTTYISECEKVNKLNIDI